MSSYSKLDVKYYKTGERVMMSFTPRQLDFLKGMALEHDCNVQDIVRTLVEEYMYRKQRLQFKPRI